MLGTTWKLHIISVLFVFFWKLWPPTLVFVSFFCDPKKSFIKSWACVRCWTIRSKFSAMSSQKDNVAPMVVNDFSPTAMVFSFFFSTDLLVFRVLFLCCRCNFFVRTRCHFFEENPLKSGDARRWRGSPINQPRMSTGQNQRWTTGRWVHLDDFFKCFSYSKNDQRCDLSVQKTIIDDFSDFPCFLTRCMEKNTFADERRTTLCKTGLFTILLLLLQINGLDGWEHDWWTPRLQYLLFMDEQDDLRTYIRTSRTSRTFLVRRWWFF